VNWLKQYGDELKTKIADGDNKSDWLNGLIKKITVHPVINETGQVGHKFDILFHLKVVRDKFEWTDKTTTPRQYEVLEGSNRLTTKSVDLKMSRGKKRVNKTE
jgi:hypothetical protein